MYGFLSSLSKFERVTENEYKNIKVINFSPQKGMVTNYILKMFKLINLLK